jgi:hypothetical protein
MMMIDRCWGMAMAITGPIQPAQTVFVNAQAVDDQWMNGG